MSTNLPDIGPRAEHVIPKLQVQLGQALGQIAMLEDVVEQLRDELVRATLPAPAEKAAG